MRRQNGSIYLALALALAWGGAGAADLSSMPAAVAQATATKRAEIPGAIRAMDGQLLLASGPEKVVHLQDLREAAAEYVSAEEQARFWTTQSLMAEMLGSLYRQQVLADRARAAKLALPESAHAVSAVQQNRDLANLYLSHEVKQRQPTDAALERFAKSQYDQTPDQYKHDELYRVSHILVRVADGVRTDAEGLARANAVLARLAQGEDFGALADELSDDRDTRGNKGSLSFREASELPADFVLGVKGMKPGEMSKSPVKTSFGYHVIWLQEARPAGRLSFEDVKERLMAAVAQQVGMRTSKGLWDEALTGFQLNTANLVKVAAAQNAP